MSEAIRLIGLDLDGTVIGPDLIVRPRVRAAIAAALARDVQVAIITGRMFAAALPFVRELGLTTPVACYQGAAIYDATSGETLAQTPVAADVAAEVFAWARAHHVHAQGYANDRLVVESINRFSKRYTALAQVEPLVVHDLAETFRTEPTIKIVLVDDPVPSVEHLAALQTLLGERAYLTRSHVDFVEVLNPRVSKGAAFGTIAERLGIPLAQTLTVGDAWNDVPLLTVAGIGIAMGSAPPELVRVAAHVVSDVDHDGVAEAIEDYVLA